MRIVVSILAVLTLAALVDIAMVKSRAANAALGRSIEVSIAYQNKLRDRMGRTDVPQVHVTDAELELTHELESVRSSLRRALADWEWGTYFAVSCLLATMILIATAFGIGASSPFRRVTHYGVVFAVLATGAMIVLVVVSSDIEDRRLADRFSWEVWFVFAVACGAVFGMAVGSLIGGYVRLRGSRRNSAIASNSSFRRDDDKLPS